MSTTFAPIAKVDDAIETFRDKAETIGSTIWGRSFMHLVHVAFFIAFVIKRDHTVLPLLNWASKVCGTAAAGIPGSLFHVAAVSFDGLWSLLLKPLGL